MLAVYRGCACDPGRSDLIAYNDDYCGLQSQISFDAVIGRQYLIEVGGYDLFAGRGVLTIVCEGEGEVLFDLGDAPDRTAGPGIAMSAYKPDGRERVQAHYPTSIRPGEGPIGPVHKAPLAVAFLGQSVSLELNAEDGPDMDLLNNIDPVNDAADQDLSDDGVILPIEMPQCRWTTFDYLVNIVEPGTPVWVNVWFDWNRDGDWDDDSETDMTMGCDGRRISEWAVRNQYLFGLPEGIHRLTSAAFVSWHPDAGPEDIWMRITLSEQPWRGGEHPKLRGNGGSGPADGFEIGETEDYVFVSSQTGQSDEPCSLCRDVNGDGRVDWEDMAALTDAWLESCQ